MTEPDQEDQGSAATAAALARVYYLAQVANRRAAQTALDRLWRRVTPPALERSWRQVSPQVAQAVAQSQYRAAATAPAYVSRVLELENREPAPLDEVPPTSFAGQTATGVPLDDFLDNMPDMAVEQEVRARYERTKARLDRIIATEVQDAGRGALDAAMRLEPQIVGYIRYVNTPCCSRCAVLAGRFYRKSDGFLRHPNCDCAHRPVTEAGRDSVSDQTPRELFDAMTDEQQDAAFTRDGARAIRDGADIDRVVNARWRGGVRGKSAGMSTPGDPYTTVRYKGAPRKRLSPQGVALQAGDDTVLYRRLLRQNGYIT